MNKAPNARFWIFWNDGLVKLTLKPGQSLTLSAGGPDEEGWYRRHERFEHCGSRVESTVLTEGRDCDGFHSEERDFFCKLCNLRANYEGYGSLLLPIWERQGHARVRDQFAEAMNY